MNSQTKSFVVAQVWLYILDKGFFTAKQNPWQYYINIDTKVLFTGTLGGYGTV